MGQTASDHCINIQRSKHQQSSLVVAVVHVRQMTQLHHVRTPRTAVALSGSLQLAQLLTVAAAQIRFPRLDLVWQGQLVRHSWKGSHRLCAADSCRMT
jgi:hypothetical protein